MRCISPLTVRVKNKLVVVPCGRCTFCLQTRRADWTFRINQESKGADTAFFLTLTYDNFSLPIEYVENYGVLRCYPYEHSLVKKDFQDFMKRLRKAIEPVKVRYFMCGEYGEKFGRPHYHLILFNMPLAMLTKIEGLWGLGFVKFGNVEIASIHYVTKYVMKPKVDYGGREPPFVTMSRRPGLGSRYLVTHGDWHKKFNRNFSMINGQVSRLPRFYKEKLFSQLQRERFALEAIDIGTEEYRKAVEALKRYHPDPENYYYERLCHMYEAATKQLISK